MTISAGSQQLKSWGRVEGGFEVFFIFYISLYWTILFSYLHINQERTFESGLRAYYKHTSDAFNPKYMTSFRFLLIYSNQLHDSGKYLISSDLMPKLMKKKK